MSISLLSPLSRGPSEEVGRFPLVRFAVQSRFQNEATCKTFLVKMGFICMTENIMQGTSPRFEIEALGNPEMTY